MPFLGQKNGAQTYLSTIFILLMLLFPLMDAEAKTAHDLLLGLR